MALALGSGGLGGGAQAAPFTSVVVGPPVLLHPVGNCITTTTVKFMAPVSGDAGTQVTITGSGFTGTTEVYFGATAVPAFVQNDQTIVATAPAGDAGTAVAVAVPVTGGCLDPLPVPFAYFAGQMDIEGPQDEGNWYDGFSAEHAGTVDFGIASGAVLPFATASPAFHLHYSFGFNGSRYDAQAHNIFPPGYQEQDTVRTVGNAAHFAVTLQECQPLQAGTTAAAGRSCTVQGNANAALPGQWVDVDTASADPTFPATTVSYPIASGDVTVKLTDPLDFSGHLAAELRFHAVAELVRDDGLHGGVGEVTQDSPAFIAVLEPWMVYQVKVLPWTILYAPPGDQSTASFSQSQGYAVNITAGTSQTQSNSVADVTNQLEQGAFERGFGISIYGVKFSAGLVNTDSSYWYHDTSYGTGVSAAGSQSGNSGLTVTAGFAFPPDYLNVPGPGTSCPWTRDPGTGAVNTDCADPAPIPNALRHEAFWGDRFYLLVHPQFAAWVVGTTTKQVMFAAVPTLASITVAELAACKDALGASYCVLHYSTSQGHGTETLSAQEAQRLLALDPFYAQQTQAADPNAGSPGRSLAAVESNTNQLLASVPFGADGNLDAQQQVAPEAVLDSSAWQVQNTQASGTTSYVGTVTDIIGSTQSTGGQITFFGGGGGGNWVTAGEQEATSQTVQINYQDSTAVTQLSQLTAHATLQDYDNTHTDSKGQPDCVPCHGPLAYQPSVNIYLDRKFGSFMFQDPTAPRPVPSVKEELYVGSIVAHVQAVAQGTGQSAQGASFSDVKPGYWAQQAIDLLAARGVLAGFPDGTFGPDGPVTRAQFAKMLAMTVGLRFGGTTSPFADVPPGQWYAPYVSAAAAAGIVQGTSARSFYPDAPVTREQMAVIVSRALRLGAGSPPPFTDASVIDPWARAGVGSVVAAGYLKGFPDGSFQPLATTTRAQAAEVLSAALQRLSQLP